MIAEITTAVSHLDANCSSKDRILLINPPVIETRYQWIRWNQPLDLLKLSSFLKLEKRCDVKLYDFMLPANGKVTRTASKARSEFIVGKHSYPLWRYGQSNEKFRGWLTDLLSMGWRPTQIWITSLTSYWWLGVSSIIPLVKSVVPAASVVLYGQYPRVETEHAQQNSDADVIIKDGLDLSNCFADFSLYGGPKPSFCGLDARAANWHDEALEKYKSGVADFVFFNDDILDPAIDLLARLRMLREQVPIKSNHRLRFHAMCGLYPARFTEHVAEEMRKAGFVDLHFEQQLSGGELDIEAYVRARRAYHHAGYALAANEVSGFLFIGMPNDNLELIVQRMLNLLEVWGSVILKPYTPDPTLPEYQQHRPYIENEEIERLSPHAFPFSKVNGIAYDDYDELYTLAAALNHKVKNKAFNSFPGTLAFEMIRTSLEREVWTLGYEERTTH